MSSYYERNKNKIREQRKNRYEQQKQNNLLQLGTPQRAVPNTEWGHVGKAHVPLVFLVLFSLFLVWQGALFFMKQGHAPVEAYIVSVFGELLLIVSSGLVFYAETKKTKQLFMVICSLSIFLLGAFLHNGVKDSLLSSSPEYKRSLNQYQLVLSDINSLKENQLLLPANYLSKKNQIQIQINSKTKTLSILSQSLKSYEGKNLSLGQYYVAWIRIALMVINAYLVHVFLREFLGGPVYV